MRAITWRTMEDVERSSGESVPATWTATRKFARSEVFFLGVLEKYSTVRAVQYSTVQFGTVQYASLHTVRTVQYTYVRSRSFDLDWTQYSIQ